MSKKTITLLILDGFGHSSNHDHNAISHAITPNLDFLKSNYPNGLINASENHVGLPDGQMGNSEVGHINIGAGRVVYQDIQKINNSIRNNDLQNNVVLKNSFDELKKNQGRLHFLGLLSDGGVHSHYDHFEAFLKIAKDNGINNTYVHAFLDGRDTPPKSAKKYLDKLDTWILSNGYGVIGSISGRFYAMDRDNRWDRVKLAYDMLTEGKTDHVYQNSIEALDSAYHRGETDEFVLPSLIDSESTIQEKDMVVFLNFRSDRGRELTRAFKDKGFTEFERSTKLIDLNYLTMTIMPFLMQ